MSPNAYIERRIEKVPVVTTVISEQPVFDIKGLTAGEIGMLFDGLGERKATLYKLGLPKIATNYDTLLAKLYKLFKDVVR